MAYAYWSEGRTENPAVFDLFFRKNPFKGEFCVFAGLEEVIRFVESFRYERINSLSLILIVFLLLASLQITSLIFVKSCPIVRMNSLTG
jgi:nicotinic acid phosphoribosyltransferase